MSKNLIEQAQKVMAFKANVVRKCKEQNLRVPSDEKIGEWYETNGTNLYDFMHDYTHFEGIFRKPKRQVSDLEKYALETTLGALDEKQLCVLWNVYNNEVDGGNANYVFDLADDHEAEVVKDKVNQDTLLEICRLVTQANTRFVTLLGDDEVHSIDIVELVKSEWGSIFERIVMFPYCYEYDYKEGEGYFTDIIAPIMFRELGFFPNYQTNEVIYEGKK